VTLLPELERALIDGIARRPSRRRAPRARRRGGRAVVLACALSLVSATALAATGAIHVPGLSPAPAAHQPLRVLDGHRAATLASYRGGVLVVTFYGSWCSPCARQVRLVDEQRARLEASGRGTAVLIGYEERDDDARRFVRGHGLGLPVLQDPGEKVARAYGIRGVPATFVIDAAGDLVSTTNGIQTRASLARDVRRAERGSG